VPRAAILAYDNVVQGDPDRSGNWRFLVSTDGGYYHQRNGAFFVDPVSDDPEDPSRHWSRPFPSEPAVRFDAQELEQLESALERASFRSLRSEYRAPSARRRSHPVAERWTAFLDRPVSVVVEEGFGPPELTDLWRTIERLVDAASRRAGRP
jgi:hypothetical protein